MQDFSALFTYISAFKEHVYTMDNGFSTGIKHVYKKFGRLCLLQYLSHVMVLNNRLSGVAEEEGLIAEEQEAETV